MERKEANKEVRIAHVLYCPLTGLGLYGGHRGKRWLKNRIQIFCQFVLPSLCAQTTKNFTLWVSVRHEDRHDSLIREFRESLEAIQDFKTVFTYAGVCFWDDKYPDDVARVRLVDAVHGSLGELINILGDFEYILETIQPSDDCYHHKMVEGIQAVFSEMPGLQAVGFKKGYVMDYKNLALAEWNPTTIPPFFTIKFPRETFIDPLKHVEYAGYRSHEYIADKLNFGGIEKRGFIVGTHGENISTYFNHPFKGKEFSTEEAKRILTDFGLGGSKTLTISMGAWRRILRRLPHGWQKKVRYWFGERLYAKIYDFLRS